MSVPYHFLVLLDDRTTLDNKKLWTTAVVLKLFHIKDPQNDNYQPAERHLKRHTRNYHLAGDPLELPQGPFGGPYPTLRANGLQYMQYMAHKERNHGLDHCHY